MGTSLPFSLGEGAMGILHFEGIGHIGPPSMYFWQNLLREDLNCIMV